MYVMYSSKIKTIDIQCMMHDNCQNKKNPMPNLKKKYDPLRRFDFFHKKTSSKKIVFGFTLSENRDNQSTHVKPVPPFKNPSFFGETLGGGTAHLKGL